MSPPNTDQHPGTYLRGAKALLAILATIVIVAAVMPPAAGQSRKQLQQEREKVQRIQAQLNDVAQSYATKRDQLEATRAKISTTQRKIREAKSEASHLQEHLRDRVRTAYRMGGLGFFDFLMSAESLSDFSLRVVLLQRQASRDEDVVLKLKKLQGQLEAEERVLEQQKKEQATQAAALREEAAKLNATFKQQQAVLARVESDVRRQELARAMRVRAASVSGSRVGGSMRGGSGRVIALQSCPALGPRTFTNDWGAPRGGGRRRHRGNDIFAPQGSPAGAVVSGRISRLRSGGLGGLSVYLWGDDGNEYYYAHMSGFNVSQGQRVSAGQTIAYVGNTGNARGGAPHIHFEVHPGGGGAINPYPSLIRVC